MELVLFTKPTRIAQISQDYFLKLEVSLKIEKKTINFKVTQLNLFNL